MTNEFMNNENEMNENPVNQNMVNQNPQNQNPVKQNIVNQDSENPNSVNPDPVNQDGTRFPDASSEPVSSKSWEQEQAMAWKPMPSWEQDVNDKKTAKAKRKERKKRTGSRKVSRFLYKGTALVASAAVFGMVAVGTIYFVGDKTGIINTKAGSADKVTKVSSTQITGKKTGAAAVGLSNLVSDQKEEEHDIVVTDVSQVVENVMPSIVSITSTQMVQSVFNDWWGFYGGEDRYEEQKGAGSGIIIGQNDTELLIVTNNHVVEGADSLQVQFIDDETVDANIKGTNSDNDLAVVSIKLSDIKKETLEKIKIATLGNSDELMVGEGTIAIGNALGYGQSVTTGVVSALNREVTIDNRTMMLIQTDAAINPGNSGGALLNTKGEVIGINSAKYSSSSIEGMGFAIPVSEVEDVIQDLMNRKTLVKVDPDKKGYINIKGRDVTEELAAAYDAPVGVLVVEVIEKGAAEKAGIERSDIITAINGDKVTSMKDLQERLEYYEKGTTVTLTVQVLEDKEYVEKKIDVTLNESMD